MATDGISEDLKTEVDSPHNITVLALIAGHVDGDGVNENMPKLRCDALAVTLIAVMTCQTPLCGYWKNFRTVCLCISYNF